MFQTKLAPPSSPSWATDPAELWNRVEQAEKRKDVQIARDYRVPLPLGLSDADTTAMAIEVAQFIAGLLTRPVSLAVHRDVPITVFGDTKTDDKIGCHAHLYFPTRKILLEGDAADGGASGSAGMDEKLSFLSNKTTSGRFVDTVNELWAKTANWYTARVGLSTDFDHRSYRRQGLKLRPEPREGAAATAMERDGHRTLCGDAVLEARAMLDTFRRVHKERERVRQDADAALDSAAASAPFES